MGLSVKRRVHVMPVGYEYERIVTPAEDFRADLVVLINHTDNDEEGEECWHDAQDGLTERNIEYQTSECDIFDLYSALGTIAEVISNHQQDDVYVNVSSGSKITAIAGMIASMVTESTAYYARANDYSNTPSDISEVAELPTYPINAPDKDQVTILEFINSWSETHGPPTKGEVIHFSEQANLNYISNNVAGKGKYRLLDTHIVEPLRDRAWVEVTKQGRNKVITLTQDGEAALNAFRWMGNHNGEFDEAIRRIEENLADN